MEKPKLNFVYFEELKGLFNVCITFEKPLTAIMGVNGAGKTTIIHALACLFRPKDNGENYKFPFFFTPNTDASWKNSKLTATMSIEENSGSLKTFSRIYKKDFDRWSPRYENRPVRSVYYIGINSCLPEIEQFNKTTSIIYTSKNCTDRPSKRIIEKAAYILNKDYDTLTRNIFQDKSLIGVRTKGGLKYSSLSMGSGEQRTIRILQKMYEAEAYSLILIDEIDLLMHVSALYRMIKILHEIAVSKHIQIVFTTHAMEMCEMSEYVGIQYINTVYYRDGAAKTFVYNRITTDLVYSLTGHTTRPIRIYVEDVFAKGIIKDLVCKMGLSTKVEIGIFGSAFNGFTLASGMFMSGENTENCIVVLDGDKYRSEVEKLEMIQKVLTGTEDDIHEKRNQVLSLITQFSLPEDKAPEKFFHELLIDINEFDNEITKVAKEINAVSDSHEWIYEIQKRLGETEEYIVRRIVDAISISSEFSRYIASIQEWLEKRIDI